MPKRIPNEKLIDDLQRVAEKIGRAPTTREYDEHGQYQAKTLRNRWETWEDTLEFAELDPESRECSNGGGFHVVCPNCTRRQRYGGERDRFQCKECLTTVPLWRGRIAKFRENTPLQQLATGPKTPAELEYSPEENVKDLIGRLEPHTARSYHKARSAPRKDVLYLYGDERAAIRKFIDVNESYIADVLSDQRNPLQSHWEHSLYEMLIQQWEWRDEE
jgi:hypothetical protein